MNFFKKYMSYSRLGEYNIKRTQMFEFALLIIPHNNPKVNSEGFTFTKSTAKLQRRCRRPKGVQSSIAKPCQKRTIRNLTLVYVHKNTNYLPGIRFFSKIRSVTLTILSPLKSNIILTSSSSSLLPVRC